MIAIAFGRLSWFGPGATRLHDQLMQRAQHATDEKHMAVRLTAIDRELETEPAQYTTPANDAERRAFSAFEDAVIGRPFALNARRAEEKRLAGLSRAKPAAKSSGRRGKRANSLLPLTGED